MCQKYNGIVTIFGKHITRPQQLGARFTHNDGIGAWDGFYYRIHNCTIDMSDADDCDEACAITYGSGAEFCHCRIRGAGKLVLCGSGDAKAADKEKDKTVLFSNCIFEDFGRRGPEVQCGMSVIMNGCLIRNWADPEHFDKRSFGAWAHKGGKIEAYSCVFWQDNYRFKLRDIAHHVGQAIHEQGLKALFKPSSYISGCRRGLTATDGGEVNAKGCYKNQPWIILENSNYEIESLTQEVAELITFLENTCGCEVVK